MRRKRCHVHPGIEEDIINSLERLEKMNEIQKNNILKVYRLKQLFLKCMNDFRQILKVQTPNQNKRG